MTATVTRTVCRDCKGSGSHPEPYLCLWCLGKGYHESDPHAARALAQRREATAKAASRGPRCSQCDAPSVYTAEAWADVWRCSQPACGHTSRYSLGD